MPSRPRRPGHRRVLLGLVAALLAGCTDDPATALPPGPATGVTTPSVQPSVTTPAPKDGEAAVPDSDAGRSVSPAQGTLELAVRGDRPGGEPGAVHEAYVGWVRASLTAFARPGEDEGGLERYAAPEVVRDVRERVRQLVLRGWAEYGTATLSGVNVRVTGEAAAVSAGLDLSGLATRDAAGRLAQRDRPVRSTATLARSGSRWLVTADRRTGVGRC